MNDTVVDKTADGGVLVELGPSAVCLEGLVPLSRSILWDVQHEYWERGPLAWASKDVPFLLTTGPVMARAYARLIEGFVEDVAAGRFGEIDPSDPIYVIDVGAGNGRLAYYILKALDHDYIRPMRIVYVIADRARANLEFCSGHPRLAPYFEAGMADIALYDAEQDQAIALEKLGVELSPGRVSNPIVALASYLMCVIPQDAFTVVDGELLEEQVQVIAEEGALDGSDPAFFRKAAVACRRVAPAQGRYGPRLTAVLESIAAERQDGRRFLFPADGIRLLDSVTKLAGERSMVIVGDRQEITLPDVVGIPVLGPGDATPAAGEPPAAPAHRASRLFGMGMHGASISLPVEFAILGRAAELAGGEMLKRAELPSSLTLGVIVSGDGGEARALRKKFRDFAVDPSPDDVWFTVHLSAVEVAPLEGLMAELRVAGYDPDVFVKAYPGLEALLPLAGERIKNEIAMVLDRIYEMDYRVNSNDDLAFGIGLVLAKGRLWERAIEYFERSKENFGPRSQTSFNSAMCHLHLEDRDTALAADTALEIDPKYTLARTLRTQVLAGEDFEEE